MPETIHDLSGIEFQNAAIQLLDALNTAAVVFDRRGRVVGANPKLCAMLGRPRDEVIGRNLRDFYTDDEGRDYVNRTLAEFDNPREAEGYLPLPGGKRLEVLLSGGPLSGPPPASDHRMVVFLDISKQKRAEQSLEQRYRDIAQLSDTVLEQALSLKDYSKTLEQRVHDRTEDLRLANMDAIYMLAVASEAKDADTGAHVRRIEHSARAIARGLGLSDRESDQIGYSAILHDVGKMQVPDEVLKKPGRLTPEERAVMEQHTLAGERILSNRPFFALARQIARSHHENWDGTGYPDRIAGETIPLAARIVHVADVFDALVSARVYKSAWTPAEAMRKLESSNGTEFDPRVITAFRQAVDDGTIGAR